MKNGTIAAVLLLGSLLWTGCGDDSSPTGPSANPPSIDTAKKTDGTIKADTTKLVDTTTKSGSATEPDTSKHTDSVVIAKPDSTKIDTTKKVDTTVVKVDTTKKPDTTIVTGPPISVDLIGKWLADTAMTVSGIPVGITSTVIFRADGTFLSTMAASVLGNPIAGDLYRGEGMWVNVGSDMLVATSTTCTASDTATGTGYLAGKSLPFKQAGNGFAANAHKPTECPAPMVLTERPVAGKMRIVQSLTIPTQGKQDLPLTFVLKP
ncbi:MAG: hypothetical protein IPK50_16260 [Fibrobacterota bacterium]|nr:hypothetical protein [Fibrobacterota bacterium]QQS03837.1 MAG: hypothetical protein IPK50_16260 [Fibrobacterota bacterium]